MLIYISSKSSASARDNAPPTGSITPDDNARTTGSTSPGESALSTADVSKPVSTAENLLTHRAEYTNADGDLIYWGYVLELGAQKQMAVVTLWIDDSYGPSVGCSTKGYDGLDPLELGDWVQIRLVMYGEHGGETFAQHALKHISR